MIRWRPTEAHRRASPGAAVWCAAIVLLTGTPIPASAQVRAGVRIEDIGINAAIGLATAAAWSVIHGHGVTDGATRGLIGGATMGIGRQVAASPFTGAGFAGREISAVGISLMTSPGDEPLSLWLPIGPMELQVKDGRAVNWRVNATNVVAAIINASGRTARLDAGMSLASGALVFRSTRAVIRTSHGEASGSELFDSITLSRAAFDGTSRFPNVLFHENVHVLQEDYLASAVANPLERSVLNQSWIGRRITPHINLGLLSLSFISVANSVIPYHSRPWEREAYTLTPLHNY